MIYFAEKTRRLRPADVKGRSRVVQWRRFPMSGVGLMMGIDRYQNDGGIA